MATRLRVFSGYRKLLRQAAVTFKGDAEACQSAKVVLRQHFEENRGEKDQAKIEEAVSDIDDILLQLRTQVVQAHLNEKGNYEMELPGGSEDPSCKTAFEPLDLSDAEAVDKHLADLEMVEQAQDEFKIEFHPNDGSHEMPQLKPEEPPAKAG